MAAAEQETLLWWKLWSFTKASLWAPATPNSHI